MNNRNGQSIHYFLNKNMRAMKFGTINVDTTINPETLTYVDAASTVDSLIVDGKMVTTSVEGRLGSYYFEKGVTFNHKHPSVVPPTQKDQLLDFILPPKKQP